VQTSLKPKTKSNQPPADVLGEARQRAVTTRGVADRLSMAAGVPLLALWSASLLCGSVSLAGYVLRPGTSIRRAFNRAVLVGHCVDDENIWTTKKMLDSEGRAFDASGVKCACGSRLCSYCIKRLQLRAQRRLVTARDTYWYLNERETGKYERFVTLTGPTLQGVGERDAEQIYNYAFLLLSDTPFWDSRVDAGAKHLEFTVNSLGYHAHIHALIYGPFIERDENKEAETRRHRAEREAMAKKRGWTVHRETPLPALGNLQDAWTRCLTTAVLKKAQRKIEWHANYDDELRAFVLGPYCLLSSRVQIVPEIKAGWYSLLPDAHGEVIEVQPTPSLKAGVRVEKAREKSEPSKDEISVASAIKELTKYITRASSWSDIPDEHLVEIAQVERWPRCFELLKGWRGLPSPEEICAGMLVNMMAHVGYYKQRPLLNIEPGETWEAFCLRVKRARAQVGSYKQAWDTLNREGTLYEGARSVNASLDTGDVFRSEETRAGPQSGSDKPRAPSLMKLGDVLAFDVWLKLVAVRLVRARRARMILLARDYPHNSFVCLDGSTFVGEDIKGESRSARIEAAYQTMQGQY
jgi:hypothetical protein